MGKSDFGISRAEITFIVCEAICILFYGLFTEYDELNMQKINPLREDEAQ